MGRICEHVHIKATPPHGAFGSSPRCCITVAVSVCKTSENKSKKLITATSRHTKILERCVSVDKALGSSMPKPKAEPGVLRPKSQKTADADDASRSSKLAPIVAIAMYP